MTSFMQPGNTAVITGGAKGIGLAAAQFFLHKGMRVLLADSDEAALAAALEQLETEQRDRVITRQCDVSDVDAMKALADDAFNEFGQVNCLMNNAGIIRFSPTPWEHLDHLDDILKVNLMGVIHGCHAFIPRMLESGAPGVIINTGSKQGITRPPGSYTYNLSKAGVLAYTESVAHALVSIEGCQLSAHLLVPGSVYTPMLARFIPEKPDFAWTAEQTIDFALPCIERGDFYVICPDNESPRALDEKRMQWSADDLIKNRPALSRWHPDFKAEYEAWIANVE